MNFLKLYFLRKQLKHDGQWKNYPLFPYKFKAYIRNLIIVEKQGRVALSASLSLTITVILGLLSLIIPLYLTFQMELWSLIAVVVMLFLVPVMAAHASLRSKPYNTYAKLALTGQSPTHSIVFISQEIKAAIENVACYSSALHRFFKKQLDLLNGVLRNDIDSVLKLEHEVKRCWAQKVLQKRTKKLQTIAIVDFGRLKKIHSLKAELSRMLHIPERRICDHIFQYSPSVHEQRVIEYVENCWELLDSYTHIDQSDVKNSKVLIEAIMAVLEKNVWIYENGISRLPIQEALIHYCDLHGFVSSMAASPSCTSSVKKYVRSLSLLARDFEQSSSKWQSGKKKSAKSKRNKLKVHKAKEVFHNKTKFLYRKQRAYPGADLNYLCLNILNSFQGEEGETILALKKFLRNGLRRLPSDALIKGLFDFEVLINKFLKEANGRLLQNFCNHLAGEFGEYCQGREVFFLTQGYSRTVKVCLENIMINQRGRVFILRPVNSPYGIKSQLLYSELRESYRKWLSNGSQTPLDDTPHPDARIAICDQFLMPEILPENAIVVILSGAEMFDDGMRVVNCQQEEVKKLIDKFRKYGIEFKCISLTCEYKKSEVPLYDNKFITKDHLEGMDSLTKSVSWIITDQKIYSRRPAPTSTGTRGTGPAGDEAGMPIKR